MIRFIDEHKDRFGVEPINWARSRSRRRGIATRSFDPVIVKSGSPKGVQS
jgi:hypothetical protein